MHKNYQNDPTIYLAHKMWSIFQEAKYFSKRILFFLFGNDPDNLTKSMQDIFSGYEELASLYPKN